MGSILTGFIKFRILSMAQIGGVQQGHIFLGLLLQGTDFFIHRCWILSGASVQMRFRSSDLWCSSKQKSRAMVPEGIG